MSITLSDERRNIYACIYLYILYYCCIYKRATRPLPSMASHHVSCCSFFFSFLNWKKRIYQTLLFYIYIFIFIRQHVYTIRARYIFIAKTPPFSCQSLFKVGYLSLSSLFCSFSIRWSSKRGWILGIVAFCCATFILYIHIRIFYNL